MAHIMIPLLRGFLPDRIDIRLEGSIKDEVLEFVDRGEREPSLSAGTSVCNGLMFLDPKYETACADFGFLDPLAELGAKPLDRVLIVQWLIRVRGYIRREVQVSVGGFENYVNGSQSKIWLVEGSWVIFPNLANARMRTTSHSVAT